jgi:hypothetical protein
VTILAVAPRVHAQENDALKILKTMSDYLTSRSGFSAEFDIDLEIITPDIQKIQYTSSGRVSLSRPDKLRAHRLGGYSDAELVFDGKTLTLVDKYRNVFAQAEAPGSVDQLIEQMRQDLGIEMPGGDLLLSKVYDGLTSRVIDAKYIGRGVIDGVECEHLAFRNAAIDWQIWIEGRPAGTRNTWSLAGPCRGAAVLCKSTSDLRSRARADAFQFTPTDGAKKVALEELKNMTNCRQRRHRLSDNEEVLTRFATAALVATAAAGGLL